MIIIVEGNIGSGKTTFSNHLCNSLLAKGYNVLLYTEPVAKWKNVAGYNLLDLYYRDKKRWAFTFQVNALMNVAEIESNALLNSLNNSIVIMERGSSSVFKIFCQYLSKHVFNSAETSIIEDLKSKYSNIVDNYNKVLFIFIKTDRDICFNRIYERSRAEEINHIDIQYLTDLESLYEEFVNSLSKPSITVDGTSFNTNTIENSITLPDHKNALDEILTLINSIR